MPTVDVNLVAVLVCGVVSMALGMVWYSPKTFGAIWMRENGKTVADIEKEKQKGMGWRYALAFVGALLTAYVLAHVVDYAAATTVVRGVQTGFWMWLGLIVPVQLGSVLWDEKSWKYFAITTGYQFVLLLIFGALLATWA